MRPSSVVCTCTSTPSRSRMRRPSAMPHGAFTRPPNGAWSTMRTEPTSSRKCSSTRCVSSGTMSRDGALRLHVLDERARRRLVGVVARLDRREVVERARVVELATQLADARREVGRARHELAVPEGHPRRRAGRGDDDHAIVLDRADAPGGAAELEDVADARLVHELLVQLAEPRLVRRGSPCRVRGRGSCRRRSSRPCATQRAGVSTSLTRSQETRASSSAATSLGYLPDEHREHFVERRARERVVRIRAAHEVEQVGRSSTRRSDATMATMICASTSSAFWTTRVGSTSPARIASTMASCSSASSRKVGTNTPRLVASSECPARPTRCSAAATRFGLWSWTHEVHRADVDARARGSSW